MDQSTAQTCPHCRARVQPADRYCSTCGAARPGAVPLDQPPVSEVRHPRRSAPWGAALLVVLHAGLAMGAAVGVYAWLDAQRHPPPPRVAPGEPRLKEAQLSPAPPKDLSVESPEGRVLRTASRPGAMMPEPDRGVARPRTPDAPARSPSQADASAPEPPDADHATRGLDGDAPTAEDQLRGRLDGESVRMVVRHHLPQIQSCYERALKGRETLAGVVEIRLVISGEGRVKLAEVDRNNTGHEGLGKCIAFTMSTWRFPRPVGGVEIEVIYPFAFAANSR